MTLPLVFPMDGTSVWPRTSPDGKPAVYGTRNGGETWQAPRRGLPASSLVDRQRQAMTADRMTRSGLYFGTTSGELVGQPRRGRARNACPPLRRFMRWKTAEVA